MTFPSNAPKPQDGRLAVVCGSCKMAVAYVSAAMVKKAGNLTGHGLMPVSTLVSTAVDLTALRCYSCEMIANNTTGK